VVRVLELLFRIYQKDSDRDMAEHYHALIIDDELDILELISLTLSRMNIRCVTATSVTEAKKLLKEQTFHFCLTDMRLPDGDGIDIVEHIQKYIPTMPVAVITAHGNMELAVAALKAGAFDFVSKPVNLRVLRDLVNAALKQTGIIRKEFASKYVLLGESTAIESLREMIIKVARSQAPVLIQGESGTGKELVARLIHDRSARADKPFVAINCGAIPRDLMESEFFGYKKGSFTGAASDKIGLFQAADGGTLLLDEVGELPLYLQVKLLRVIQEKAVMPVGSAQEIPIDVRIISATHKKLNELVQHGEFRQDLFYRINVIELRVPPLRERISDIPILVEFLLNKSTQQPQQGHIKLTDEALACLMQYSFPGNVRELENILERAIALCDGQTIYPKDLQLPAVTQPDVAITEQSEDLNELLDTVQKDALLQALEKNHWNKTATAKQLGITLRALRYRLQKLGL
jgi:two-component system response regulator PilR (NtrC family)